MDGKRVIVVEKSQIIGQHIIVLLEKKGHEVFKEVLSIDELKAVSGKFHPQVIIINKQLFYKNADLLTSQFHQNNSMFFIVLYTLNPESPEQFSFSRLHYVEKPFLSYEISELVSFVA